MRKLFFVFFLLLGSCASLNKNTLPTKYYYRYEVISAHVVYTLEGIKHGTEELFFDRYGNRQVKFSHLQFNIGASEKNLSTITLYEKDSVFLYNRTDKRLRSYTDSYLFEEAQKAGTLNLGRVQLKLLEQQGYRPAGTKEYLHKNCNVYATPDNKQVLYVWKNIPLYSESNLLNIKNIQRAIRIQTELDIPEEKFILPVAKK